jgi:fructose-specific phosphotransferase system IIA component
LNITETTAALVLQLGVILFAVRAGGAAARKIGIPAVLGELIAGIIIGPYAAGGLPLPGFPHGLFTPENLVSGIAVSSELYAFSSVGAVILLFMSGLETDLGLFLRYSIAGGVIGIGGALFSFVSGDLTASFFLDARFMDPRCLFFGVLSTATSVGITARILSERKKMDSPEGVTILAAAVFDDVLGIIILAIVLGIVALVQGTGGVSAFGIATIAAKAFGIWLGFSAIGLIFSKRIAGMLKLFSGSYNFSLLALGLAFLLAGLFEEQGLAMIIGAYVAGLSLSKTDIAVVVQDRMRGLYEFFVPVFFAVMGMMVNVAEIFSRPVLIFGGVYTLFAIVAKITGCAFPALALGFNWKGALRIGMGMVPRGEVALIIAGIGLASGVLNNQFFSVIILMTLFTTLFAPGLLSFSLNIPGSGTQKPVKDETSVPLDWDFGSEGIAGLVINTLLQDLKDENFYVQTMNKDEGLSQARKDNISFSIIKSGSMVNIICSKANLPYIKTAMYEVIVELRRYVQKLREMTDAGVMRKEIAELDGGIDFNIFSLIDKKCVSTDLKGETKEEIIVELVQLLAFKGKLNDYDLVLRNVLQREEIVSTGMEHGVALPHAKTDGVDKTVISVGVKKGGIDFQSVDGEKSCIFVLTISPLKHHSKHLSFLSSITSLLKNQGVREKIMTAKTPEEIEIVFKEAASRIVQ